MSINYTQEQKSAIETLDEHLQIIACAGSGKTGVVTERIVSILKKKQDIKPGNIVAFTFTEKAAGELKDRIYKRVKSTFGEDYLGMAEMYIGTIHGFCLNLLQDHYAEYNKYQVLNEVRTKLFIDKNASKFGFTKLKSSTGKFMKPYLDTNIFISLMSILRESDIEEHTLPEEFKEILINYNKTFESKFYLDFTMIMEKAIYHLKNDSALQKKVKHRVKYLTVDEYQDINPIQEKLIRILYDLGANICVVGDDDQTIYQWRGSEIKNILTFKERYNKPKAIYLVDNFRSSSAIIDIAKRVINKNAERMPKEMKYKNQEFKYSEADTVYKEFESDVQEFGFIADRIIELKKAGMNYSDMAILIRIKKIGASLIQTLDMLSIPYVIEGVNELFDTTEVKACVGIYHFLEKKIERSDLINLWLSLQPKYKKLNNEKLIEAIDKLEKIEITKDAHYYSFNLQQIFHDFIDDLELKEEENEKEPELEIILYNLGKFSQVIDDFESINYMSRPTDKLKYFNKFLEYTAESYYPEGHLQNVYLRPDAVRIMTVHQSKGLEFPVVFVPTLTKNYFPIAKHGGLSVWHFLDRSLVKNQERYESGNLEDERRLFYVAVTRAKKFLFLTRAIYGDKRKSREVSTFLIEAKKSAYLLEYDNRMNYKARTDLVNLKLEPPEIVLNFSVLSDFYHCPYRYKMTYFYGFVQPLSPRLGYGRSLHDIVMKIHRTYEAEGEVNKKELPEMIEGNFYLPYADPLINKNLKEKAIKSINGYYDENYNDFSKILFSEKEIEIDFANRIRVTGRMDLVKRQDLDGERTFIVDFKTADREAYLHVNEEQLKIYALGYQKLSGEKADYIEFYNLDNNDRDPKRLSNEEMLHTEKLIVDAANEIRSDHLPKTCSKEKCSKCYMSHLCLHKILKSKYEFKKQKAN